MASDSIAELPVTDATMNLVTAMATFATIAPRTARLEGAGEAMRDPVTASPPGPVENRYALDCAASDISVASRRRSRACEPGTARSARVPMVSIATHEETLMKASKLLAACAAVTLLPMAA